MSDLTTTIAAIREAATKATPRPWRVTDELPCETYGVEATIAAADDDVVVSTLWHEDMALAMRPYDRDLIVLAANHITELCDEVERLERRLRLLADGVEQRLVTLRALANDCVVNDCDAVDGGGAVALDIRSIANLISEVLVLGRQTGGARNV